MKLAIWRDEITSTRRAARLLIALLTLSLLINVLLSVVSLRMSGRERTVLVPPGISKTFWVDATTVSAEYLEQMAYFLVQLTLDVTPQSVDHQSRLLLQYASPAAYGELHSALFAAAERLKRDGAATVFNPQELSVEQSALRVGVRGQLTTFIGDRRVADSAKAYVLEFEYRGGRIFLKTLRETNPNDPLDAQPRAATAAG